MSLAASYDRCRSLHREHGRTYYLATRLLPSWKRRHVHALYGFTRYTDDIVDTLYPGASGRKSSDDRAERLEAWIERFRSSLAGPCVMDDPILPAVVHTVAVFGLDRGDFDAFLASMRMDLTTSEYADYEDLLRYMEGSAAVIGTMMLPILMADAPPALAAKPACDEEATRESARQLGLAFQLTNFIRDVAEDFSRGRVYLPQADLAKFGVTRDDLAADSATPELRELVAFEIERARRHYALAEQGFAHLPQRSRRCIRVAFAVYGRILDEIERADHDVLAGRVSVPTWQRVGTAVRELTRQREIHVTACSCCLAEG